jgi:hypothetical protein
MRADCTLTHARNRMRAARMRAARMRGKEVKSLGVV